MGFLDGKKALIVGIANERSLAWAIAQHLHQEGAKIAATYWGEKMEKRVRPLAESLKADLIENMDVSDEKQVAAVYEKIQKKWGGLDILIHSVAYANREDLDGRFIDTSREGFRLALDVSAYSLLPLARQAAPLMKSGGTILTLSFEGATRVIPHYNVMGVAKAALEAVVRYLAYDLGEQKIRVNAISAGPIKTLAAAGIKDFREKLDRAESVAPLKENIDADDVGALAAFLCGPGGKHITGANMFVDSGVHIM